LKLQSQGRIPSDEQRNPSDNPQLYLFYGTSGVGVV
jgi:hypothetical protein